MFRRLYSDGSKSIPSLQVNPTSSSKTTRTGSSEVEHNRLEMSDRHVYANPSYHTGHFEAATMQIGGLPFYLPPQDAPVSEQPHQKVGVAGAADEHLGKCHLFTQQPVCHSISILSVLKLFLAQSRFFISISIDVYGQ